MVTRSILIVCLMSLAWLPARGWAKTVSLPISMEYPMLRSLVVAIAFTEDGEQAQVVDEAGGCRRVTLSEPTFGQENGKVRFATRVAVRAGVLAGSRCVLPVEWEGYLVMFQRPLIDPQTWRLSFEIESSVLETLERKPAKVAGVVWDIIKKRVYTYIQGVSVDLSLPVAEVKAFVHGLIAADALERAQGIIEGMRPGEVTAGRTALLVPILADFEETVAATPEESFEPTDAGQGEALVETWQAWDEFLVSMITSLARKPLTDDERQVLFGILLDTRYRFADALAVPFTREDFVRRQFVDAWGQLSPVFRAHLTAGATRTLLGYLAFFSASDALTVLDAIGPALGIEVSRGGLVRLIQLLSEGPPIALDYRPDVNSELRQTLGLDAKLETPSQTGRRSRGNDRLSNAPTPKGGRDRLFAKVFLNLFPSVWAADSEPPVDAGDVNAWLPSLAGAENYRVRIRALLSAVAERSLERSPLNAHFYDLCRKIIPAVAWQESCMRQFTTENGQAVYLRSYNGSSVGIMQINERVWRGIYDLKQLRWEIEYNAHAGAEIVALYFHRFLLPKVAKSNPDLVLDEALLARLLYAMYNAGPGEFDRFLKRHREGRYYLSDRLFFERYEWVESGQWQHLMQCFGG